MSENKTYHEQQTQKNILKLRELLKELPPFAADYFRSVEFTTESRTKLSYATDLKTFFTYIKENNPSYGNTSIRDFKLDILEHITPFDIEEYLINMRYYEKDGKSYSNNELAIINIKLLM